MNITYNEALHDYRVRQYQSALEAYRANEDNYYLEDAFDCSDFAYDDFLEANEGLTDATAGSAPRLTDGSKKGGLWAWIKKICGNIAKFFRDLKDRIVKWWAAKKAKRAAKRDAKAAGKQAAPQADSGAKQDTATPKDNASSKQEAIIARAQGKLKALMNEVAKYLNDFISMTNTVVNSSRSLMDAYKKILLDVGAQKMRDSYLDTKGDITKRAKDTADKIADITKKYSSKAESFKKQIGSRIDRIGEIKTQLKGYGKTSVSDFISSSVFNSLNSADNAIRTILAICDANIDLAGRISSESYRNKTNENAAVKIASTFNNVAKGFNSMCNTMITTINLATSPLNNGGNLYSDDL